MKKTLLEMFIFLLAFISVLSCVFAEELLNEDEAIDIAVKGFQELDELTTEEKETYHVDREEITYLDGSVEVEPRWFVQLLGDEDDPKYHFNGYEFIISAKTGEILSIMTPSVADPDIQWKKSVSASIAGASDGDLTREEIIMLAQKYFCAVEKEIDDLSEQQRNEYTMSKNVIIAYKLPNGISIWRVQYVGIDYMRGNIHDRYIFYLNGKTGELVDFDHPKHPNPINQWYANLCLEYNGDFVSWTIEQKYAFKQGYSSVSAREYIIDNWDSLDRVNPYVIHLLLFDYRLPDDTCISQNEAINKAYQYLIEKESDNITEEYAYENYYTRTSFLNFTYFEPTGRLSWKIFFLPIDRVEYLTKTSQGPDRGYFVELDAYTGEFIGLSPLGWDSYLDMAYIE